MIKKFLDRLKLPETDMIEDLDNPTTTLLHQKIIQNKKFLKNIYIDFYKEFEESISDIPKGNLLVELGSGGGFIKEVIPSVLTSDIINLPGIDIQFSASAMPFRDSTVAAFFMIDVLHHVHDTRLFFTEITRCLYSGGKVVMIEPANTMWGRFIYKNFHHEAFDPKAGWGLNSIGPLSSANGAIPWIVFFRDRSNFEHEFPMLKISKLKPHTPLRYIISGGVSMRQLLPTSTYKLVKRLEVFLEPMNKYLGMFMTIELIKV